ncbi:mucin TcMUCII, putative, partial [Trypanosoma cruzi]
MMMTCRLLYALLVLAFCCSPSVCVTATGEDADKGSPGSPTALQQGVGGAGPANTSTTPSLTAPAVTFSGTQSQDGQELAPPETQDTARGTGGVPDPSGIPVPVVTVGSKGQGAGGPATMGDKAEKSHSTSGLQLAAEPAKTVQEQAQITGAGGPESQSTSSKEQTGSGSQTSQGLSSGDDTAQNPGEKEAVGSNKPDSKEATSGTTRDNVQETGTGSAPSASPDSTSPGNITEQQPSGSANPVQQSQRQMRQLRQPRRRQLRQRHQVLRVQRRQL